MSDNKLVLFLLSWAVINGAAMGIVLLSAPQLEIKMIGALCVILLLYLCYLLGQRLIINKKNETTK